MHAVRMIQRKNEETWWAFVPKNEEAVVSRMGELDGLDGIRSRRHLEVLPYATARSELNGTANPATPSTTAEPAPAAAGLDLKWGFSSNMTMDATVNPDFGQVEVDPAVVNLTAFETFYEEKRPFFIEGSQAFSRFGRNGASSYMGFNRTNPTLFYSRRIGRVPQGAAPGEYVDRPSATTILGAAKVDGQDEPGMDGELHRRRDRAGVRRHGHGRRPRAGSRSSRSPTTWPARVRRDVGQRAGFGMLATAVNRDLGDPALAAQLPVERRRDRRRRHLFLTGQARLRRHRQSLDQPGGGIDHGHVAAAAFVRAGTTSGRTRRTWRSIRRPRRSPGGASRPTSTGTTATSGPTRRTGLSARASR